MIFGDPYKFAIQFDFVEEWDFPNHDKDEGILNFIVNGYQKDLASESLTILDCMDSINVNYHYIKNSTDKKNLFNMNEKKSYKILYNNVLYLRDTDPNNIDDRRELLYNECRLIIDELSFDDDFIWYVPYKNKEKIIYKTNKNISSLVLKKGYCCDVFIKTLKWANQFYKNKTTLFNEFK